jgi:hypothetical protein
MATQEEIARGAKRNGRKKAGGRLSTAFDVPREGREVVTWDTASPSGIVAVTVAVSALGGAVTFGGSRDGGALQVAIFLDGEKFVKWIPSGEDIDAVLAEIWEGLGKLT